MPSFVGQFRPVAISSRLSAKPSALITHVSKATYHQERIKLRHYASSSLCHPHSWARRPCRSFAAASTPSPSTDSAVPSSQSSPFQIALSILRPDTPLVLLTATALVATVGLTLAFPLAIGDVFDVVREHIASNSATKSAYTPSTFPPLGGIPLLSPFLATVQQTVLDVQGAIATAPATFQPTLLRLCLLLVFSAAGNACVAFLAPTLGERFAVRLRKRLMAETLTKNQTFFDSTSKGEILSRLSLDVSVVQATVSDFLGARGFRSMLEILASLFIIITRNPLLAIVSFVVTPVLTTLLRKVVAHAAKLTFKRQEAAAAAMSFATERLTHVRTVQLFVNEDTEGKEYARLAEKGAQLANKCAFFQGIVEGAGRFAVNVGTLSLLGLGGALVLANKISLGTLLAFNVYNLFLSVGLSSLAGSVGDLGKAVGAMERIREVLLKGEKDAGGTLEIEKVTIGNENEGYNHEKSTLSSSQNGARGASVVLDKVSFKYPSRDQNTIENLNLEIRPGTTVALVGPSGAGKTTIAALLLGLYLPTAGTIQIDDVTLTPETIPTIRSTIGTVLQQPFLLSGTIIEQIKLGKADATEDDIKDAAAAANALEFIEKLPHTFDTEVGERGSTLSGGQKQRISIARALVRQPRLLLLDEPTAALDVEAERAVDDALKRVQGCTKVIIAHRLSTVRRADVICVIKGGRVLEQGSHRELMLREGGYYKRMVQRSTSGGNGDLIDEDSESEKDERKEKVTSS